MQISQHRIVLQQMRQRGRVGHIVHRHKINFLIINRRAHDVAPDTPKPIDSNLNRHSSSIARFTKRVAAHCLTSQRKSGSGLFPGRSAVEGIFLDPAKPAADQ